LLFLPVQKL